MDDQLLDLMAKTIFKNVKRRRLTEDQKRRVRNVAHELQKHMDTLNDKIADVVQDNKGHKHNHKSSKPRRRMSWRRDH